MGKAGEFMDGVINTAKHVASKEHEYGKAINPISKIANFTGAVEAAGRVIGGEGFPTAMRKTFGKYSADGKTLLEGDAAGWNVGKIAGSYIGAAAAGRVISGGGVYKDGRGNTNLVGIPFV